MERSTVDSKPLERLEFERLRQKGLTPTAEGRVDRKLAVARSLGDFYVRGAALFEPPEIVQFEVGADDVGLVIACDGLWDVLGDAAAGAVVRGAVTAADAAVALRNYALALGTKDNVSVIVVRWHTADVGLAARNTVEALPALGDEEDGGPPVVAPAAQAGPLRRRR